MSCIRCGLCCHKIIQDKIILSIRCKYLIKLSSGKFVCRVYRNRLDTDTGHNTRCILRKDSYYDLPGCPLNTNKPIAEIKKEKEKVI